MKDIEIEPANAKSPSPGRTVLSTIATDRYDHYKKKKKKNASS